MLNNFSTYLLAMKKLLILFYSRTGNTEKMAQTVAEGAKSVNGIQVTLSFHLEPQDLSGYDAIIVGAPTYRKEMPLDFKTLFEEAASQGINLKGKIGAVFGSYGWSAEAPKLVLDIMKEKFEMRTPEQPVIAKYIPDQAALDACRSLGKSIAENLMNTA
jgi:flavorubredoxin